MEPNCPLLLFLKVKEVDKLNASFDTFQKMLCTLFRRMHELMKGWRSCRWKQSWLHLSLSLGIVPYFLLNKYKFHYQGTILCAIEKLGVEWDIIPGRCTGLVQPIHVRISRPWKIWICYLWEDRMVKMMECVRNQKIQPFTCLIYVFICTHYLYMLSLQANDACHIIPPHSTSVEVQNAPLP